MSKLSWTERTSFLSNAVTIAVGLPALISSVAGLWAYFSPKSISIVLVMLFVFLSTLWCCIGFLWLRDRKIRVDPHTGRQSLDCSWGLVVESAFIGIDQNSTISVQISIHLRNMLTWPLRADVLLRSVVIENRTPDQPIPDPVPAIVMPTPQAGLALNFQDTEKGNCLIEANRCIVKLSCKLGTAIPTANIAG